MSKDGLTPQQRWDQKNGYITKSFRMYKGQAEVFKKACEERGQRQYFLQSPLKFDIILSAYATPPQNLSFNIESTKPISP